MKTQTVHFNRLEGQSGRCSGESAIKIELVMGGIEIFCPGY